MPWIEATLRGQKVLAKATADGALRLRGGYFDLAQPARFVFAQPALEKLQDSLKKSVSRRSHAEEPAQEKAKKKPARRARKAQPEVA